MLTIGLTGGIASGKTTVSNLFSSLNVPVIDTDIISRELLELNQPGYHKVVEHFGESVLSSSQKIDRRKLRHLVFNNESDKCWLESVLHPLIYQQTRLKIEQYRNSVYVVVVIPLLFETDFRSLVNRILVIDCGSDIQIKRLVSRDKIDLKLAQQMLAQQWDNQARLNQADDVIHNNGVEDLNIQVTNLHKKYILHAGRTP